MTRPLRIGLVLLTGLIAAMLVSLAVGAVAIPLSVIVNTLLDLDGPQQDFIINRSRLPRTLLAVVTGASLAMSGAIIQALLRNPLASPKIIGINSGAALAVLLSVVLAGGVPLGFLPAVAALGGVAAAAIIYILAEVRPVSPARLALVGIAVGFTADAGVDFILVTADTYDISAPLVWLTGSLWSRGWSHLGAVAPLLICLMGVCLLLSYRLDIIRLGSAQATGLGMHVRRARLVLLTLATLLAAVSVSVVGVLGFVGLMAPHIARLLVGGAHRTLLPVALLVGALLVVIADAAGRALVPGIEISAGILTAIFGAPFFVFLLLTREIEARS
ncbi:MAG: iron ABC transporter permease [Pseudomonadota bacterium]